MGTVVNRALSSLHGGSWVAWINAFSLFNLLFRNYLELWRLGETVQGSGAVGSNLPLSREPVKLIQVSGSSLPFSREPVKLI